MSTPGFEFDSDVIAAITRYMNVEQAQSCAYIVQAATGSPQLRAARLETFNTVDATFRLFDGTAVIVAWRRPIATRGEVRSELTRLLTDAIGM